MNASGKALIAFWLHKKGEHWTLQSVDKQSTPEVGIESIIIISTIFNIHVHGNFSVRGSGRKIC